MAIEDRLTLVLGRLAPTTREYAEHVISEWIRNLPTAIAFAEALEMKDKARELLATDHATASLVREVARLESSANRVIRSLSIPFDMVFRGEERFNSRYTKG